MKKNQMWPSRWDKLMIALILAAILGVVTLGFAQVGRADNIYIPGGENKSMWDLATDPFTRYFSDYFYAIMIGVVTGVIWMRTDNLGPTLAFFVFANAICAVIIPGDVSIFYLFCTLLATVAMFIRALVR